MSIFRNQRSVSLCTQTVAHISKYTSLKKQYISSSCYELMMIFTAQRYANNDDRLPQHVSAVSGRMSRLVPAHPGCPG